MGGKGRIVLDGVPRWVRIPKVQILVSNSVRENKWINEGSGFRVCHHEGLDEIGMLMKIWKKCIKAGAILESSLHTCLESHLFEPYLLGIPW